MNLFSNEKEEVEVLEIEPKKPRKSKRIKKSEMSADALLDKSFVEPENKLNIFIGIMLTIVFLIGIVFFVNYISDTDVKPVKKEPNKEINEVITNKEEDSKQDITNEEEIKEVEVEKVDLEYENLLKQVEYSTYDECMDIGFEKALEDTINILGFSCPYIAYKGEIIGYRLQLDYTNPMEN